MMGPSDRKLFLSVFVVSIAILMISCGSRSANEALTDLSACVDGSAMFTAAPLDDGTYSSIVPLGNLNPPERTFPTDSTYFILVDRNSASEVYAPGNIRISNLTRYTYDSTGSVDYAITFYSCKEVFGTLAHLSALSDSLAKKVGKFSDCWTYNPGSGEIEFCLKNVSIDVTAGELLGSIGGSAVASMALDFGLRDQRISPIFYVSEDKLINDDELYVVCPYDYFEDGAVKDKLFAGLNVLRTAEPLCGTVALDVAKTAQGRWYLEMDSNPESEAGHLALVPSNYDPSVGVLSVGNPDVGIAAYHFDMASDGLIGRKFSDITYDSNTYCFDNLRSGYQVGYPRYDGYLFLKMTGESSLTLERVATGNCPANPNALAFSANAVNFVR